MPGAFLNNLVTADIETLAPGTARFTALLTPAGQDRRRFHYRRCEPADGGGFFLDCPRALAPSWPRNSTSTGCAPSSTIEDLSDAWRAGGLGRDPARPHAGSSIADPAPAGAGTARACCRPTRSRKPPPILAATLVDADDYERAPYRARHSARRAWISSMAMPFRMKLTWTSSAALISAKAATSGRKSSRASSIAAPRATRIVPMSLRRLRAGGGNAGHGRRKECRHPGLTAGERGLAMLRLDRVADAMAAGTPLSAPAALPLRVVKPDWARFAFPGETEGGANESAHACDGLHRCPWPGSDPLYVAYHDDEWGVPEYDDRALFEKLILDGFQAGFRGSRFCASATISAAPSMTSMPEKIARYTAGKIEKLMQDAGIVRNRQKIEGAVLVGARLSRDHGKGPGFSDAALGHRRTAGRRSTRFKHHEAGPGGDRPCRA